MAVAVQRQTYGYLPSRKASPPIGWYQITLLGDRGTCVSTTYRGLHSTAGRLGFQPSNLLIPSPATYCYATKQHNNWKSFYNLF